MMIDGRHIKGAHNISYVLESTCPSLQTWPTVRNPWYGVGIEVISKLAAMTACVCGGVSCRDGMCLRRYEHIAADTCRHGNTPWSVQIADLNISVFAHFSDCRSEGMIFV